MNSDKKNNEIVKTKNFKYFIKFAINGARGGFLGCLVGIIVITIIMDIGIVKTEYVGMFSSNGLLILANVIYGIPLSLILGSIIGIITGLYSKPPEIARKISFRTLLIIEAIVLILFLWSL